MDAVDIFSLLVPVTYFVLFVLERIFPARQFPPIRGWAWIGIGALLLLGVTQTVVPLLLPADWLAAHRLIDGTQLGIVGGLGRERQIDLVGGPGTTGNVATSEVRTHAPPEQAPDGATQCEFPRCHGQGCLRIPVPSHRVSRDRCGNKTCSSHVEGDGGDQAGSYPGCSPQRF